MDDPINDKGAARRLAQKINDYWRLNGKPWVRAYVETQEMPLPDGRINEIYAIRSNLRFGWDRKNQCYFGYSA